jgi:hypothetical protein
MKERKCILLESKTFNVKPNKIDLSSITKLINGLNEIIAPEIDSSLHVIKKEVDDNIDNYKEALSELKVLNEDITGLKFEQRDNRKRIEVVTLLSELHMNFKLSDKIKEETLSILNSLNEMSTKRLDAQIDKLKKVLSK